MEKIGFFGGCFNPPTIAHVEIAKRALNECKLNKVIFIPMGNKYEKKDLIDFNFRLEMLNLCLNNEEKLEVSNLQENQEKKTYAIDTFKILEEKYPNTEKFFIMGNDNFIKMPKWKSYEELKEKYQYIVFKRNENILDENLKNITYIKSDFNISSSLIRKYIKENKSLDELLDNRVEEYIKNNNLYS